MDKLDFKSIIWRIKYWLKEVGLGIKNVFRRNSVKKIRNLCLVLLGILFIIAIFYHNMGRFTVTVDASSQKRGLYLYKEREFETARTRIFASALEDCNNININDLPLDVDDYDGNHYGDNYLAYTFYLRNEGPDTVSYEYRLNIGDAAKNVDSAVWVMLFRNGEFQLFAKARPDGTLERQYSYYKYDILEQVARDKHYVVNLGEDNKGLITEEDMDRLDIVSPDSLLEIRADSFISDTLITRDIVYGFEPEEYDKYTVVAWLEGEDPQCVDDILGGYVEMNMVFTVIEEEEE